jgi:hypothetical protein
VWVQHLGKSKQERGVTDEDSKGRKCLNEKERHHGSDGRDRSLWRAPRFSTFDDAVMLACLTALAHVLARRKSTFHLMRIGVIGTSENRADGRCKTGRSRFREMSAPH